jgi:predicted MFS family arabinose efflux permease
VGYGAVLPLLPVLLARWSPQSASAAHALHTGALAAVYMVAIVLLAPLWGRLSDRRGRRRVLLAGLAGFSLASLALAWAESMAQAYALRFLAGAFAGAILPAVFAAASETEDVERRTSWMARLGAASLLGYLVGPALSSAIAGLGAAGTQWALYAAAGVGLAALAIVPAGFPFAAPSRCKAAASAAPYGLARVAALSIGGMFGLGAFEVGLMLLAVQTLSLGAGMLALLFVECSVVMLLVQGWLALAPATVSRRTPAIVAAAFAAMAAGFAVLALKPSLGAAYAGVALVAGGSGALLPLLTLLASLPRGIGLGATIGIQSAAANFGQAGGSAAAGWLYAALNRESFWLYAALMALGAGIAARR